MMDLRDIYTLRDFQRRPRKYIRRLKQTRRPAVLTVNGKATLVVQHAEVYEDSLARPRFLPSDPSRELPLDPDPVIEVYNKNVDRTQLRENLQKSVAERLNGLVALQRLADEASRVGKCRRGDA